jgi:hypothetical protein
MRCFVDRGLMLFACISVQKGQESGGFTAKRNLWQIIRHQDTIKIVRDKVVCPGWRKASPAYVCYRSGQLMVTKRTDRCYIQAYYRLAVTIFLAIFATLCRRTFGARTRTRSPWLRIHQVISSSPSSRNSMIAEPSFSKVTVCVLCH